MLRLKLIKVVANFRARTRCGSHGLTARLCAMAETGDPDALARGLSLLRATGDGARIPELLDGVPAGRVDLRRPAGLAHLLTTLARSNAPAYVAALLARNPAAHTAVESAEALLTAFRQVGAHEQYDALAQRIAREFPLQDPARLRRLLSFLRYVESPATGIVAPNPVPHLDLLLMREPAAQVDLADTYEVAGLIADLREIGAEDAAVHLASRAATDAPLDDPSGVALLLKVLPPATSSPGFFPATPRPTSPSATTRTRCATMWSPWPGDCGLPALRPGPTTCCTASSPRAISPTSATTGTVARAWTTSAGAVALTAPPPNHGTGTTRSGMRCSKRPPPSRERSLIRGDVASRRARAAISRSGPSPLPGWVQVAGPFRRATEAWSARRPAWTPAR